MAGRARRADARAVPDRPDPAGVRQPAAEPAGPLPSALAEHLWESYGANATEVMELIRRDPDLGRPLAEGFPHCRAEVIYARGREMASTADDFLFRRTALGRISPET